MRIENTLLLHCVKNNVYTLLCQNAIFFVQFFGKLPLIYRNKNCLHMVAMTARGQ